MKRNIFKTISLASCIAAIIFTSCEVTDVTDIEPVYRISENNAVVTLGQAQTLLNGTYGVLIDGEAFVTDLSALTSLMGISMKPGLFGNSFVYQFYQNDVNSENFQLDAIYLKLYLLLNNANHIISKTELIETTDPRKDEIIAEAKILRGLAHFYLLRLWGEFYDIGSDNGIVLKLNPISDVEPRPKSTVAEVYDSILEDLDYGIDHGPDFSSALYTSSLFAKALKSKVLLYKKEYSAAANLALEVMDSGQRTLETEFGDVFTKKTNDPNEVLYLTPFNSSNEVNFKSFFYTYIYTVSDYYLANVTADNRNAAAVTSFNGSPRNNKFVNPGGLYAPDTEYVLRLAEVYLIYAEAVLRGNDDMEEALGALNEIRDRVGKVPFDTTDKQILLEEIRNEKFLEMGAENGEDWFDLVRYYKEGTIDIQDYKTISSDAKLILPFPNKTVLASNNMLKQNTSY